MISNTIDETKTGYRKATPAGEAARKRVKSYRQSNTRHSMPEVIRTFKRMKSHLGVTAAMYEMMDHLFSYTQEQDWLSGNAIIWPSNRRLAEELGIQERSVQLRLKKLTDLGLICHKDSPNGGRWGHRDSENNIIEGFGIDLTPLATQMTKWSEKLEKIDGDNRTKAGLRRLTTLHLKRVRIYIETVLSNTTPSNSIRADELQSLFETCAELSEESHTPHVTLDTVKENFDLIKQSADDLCSLIDTKDHPVQFQEPNTDSDPDEADPVSTDVEQDSESKIAKPIPNMIPIVHPEAHDGPACNLPINPHKLDPMSAEAIMFEHLKLYAITPYFIAKTCSAFELQLEGKTPSWALLVETSHIEAKRLGIAKHAIQKAVSKFGVYGAAVSIYVLSERVRLGTVGIMPVVNCEGALFSDLIDRSNIAAVDFGNKLHGYSKKRSPTQPKFDEFSNY